MQAAKEHPRCLKDPPPSCFLREFADNAMMFGLVFWVADIREGRLGVQSDIMINVLAKFREHGIGIPTPGSANKLENLSVPAAPQP